MLNSFNFPEVSFADFHRMCEADGIDIDSRVLDVGRANRATCHSPNKNDWYKAVANAGYVLREEPSSVLVSKEIPRSLLDVGRPHSPVENAVFGILNGSINREDNPVSDRNFSSNTDRVDGVCRDAEYLFTSAFNRMGRTAMSATGQVGEDFGGRIFVDSDGEPLAVSKCEGENSTLSLVPLTVDGVTYPAGSLFHAETNWRIRIRLGEWNVVPTSGISSLGFLRLSAFAINAGNRHKAFDNMSPGSEGLRRTLPQIGSLAVKIIEKGYYWDRSSEPVPRPAV